MGKAIGIDHGTPTSKWKLVLYEALLNMVKDFTMDPDLLNGLNKLGRR